MDRTIFTEPHPNQSMMSIPTWVDPNFPGWMVKQLNNRLLVLLPEDSGIAWEDTWDQVSTLIEETNGAGAN